MMIFENIAIASADETFKAVVDNGDIPINIKPNVDPIIAGRAY